FEFLRNDFMDTRNFFSLRTEAYKQNQYGATLGGPIRKNRLFYFGSFQGTNKRGSPSPRTITVPTAAQHNGNFSATGKTIVDPVTGAPFPNNAIPQSRWDSIGVKLLAMMPLPNSGPNRYLISPPSDKDDYQYLAKVDYVISESDHLSGRYFEDRNTYQRDNNSLPGIYGNDLFHNQTALVSETHTFGPTWVTENSVNYLRTFRHETGVSSVGSMQQLGAKVEPSITGLSTSGKMTVNVTGYTNITTPKGIDFNPATTEYKGSLSHTMGNHFLRFGGNVRHINDYMRNLGNELGAWTFNAQRTNSASIRNSGDAIAGILLGLPTTFSQNVTKDYVFTSTIFGLWVQDDWKVSRRLTLNLGVREDPWMAPRLADGVMEGFVPGMQSQVAPHAPRGVVFPGDPGISDTVLHNHWNMLAPRVGFAWDVMGDGKTIVRGGYGIYRPGSDVFSLWRYWATAAPGTGASLSISSPPSTADPYAGYTGTVPWPFKPVTKSQLANYVFPKYADLHAFYPWTKPGYTQSWNLTIERQLRRDTALSVAYVANHLIRALSALHENAAIYAPGATLEAANVDARRPYQGIGDIYTLSEYNHGSFNSLQISLTKRPSRGLILQSSYTFSKALDINSSSMLGGAAGQTPRNPYNTDMDKGPADFDTPHSFKAMVLYDLPRLSSAKGLLGFLANGWQVNGIILARKGFPFTCRSGIDNSFDGVGGDTCDQVLQNTAPPAGSDPLLYINPAAFTVNAPGTFGQVGRNTLRRPPVFNLDMAALKRTRLTERVQAEVRWEVFNAFNHANFDLFYNATTYTAQQTISNANFGRAMHARDQRLMQISMKLRF
ncbi:MAG: hypothetical protein M1335_02610, partial [Chloroflexi bacterium]|nr:hypothetical protein [Chloroflexota bacterium]